MKSFFKKNCEKFFQRVNINVNSDPSGEKGEKASFKELSAWGVFRPLAVDAAIINGKVTSAKLLN